MAIPGFRFTAMTKGLKGMRSRPPTWAARNRLVDFMLGDGTGAGFYSPLPRTTTCRANWMRRSALFRARARPIVRRKPGRRLFAGQSRHYQEAFAKFAKA